MSLVLAVLIRLLEVLFIVGIAGSAIVILLTAIEDLKDIVADDSPEVRQL